jgi:hypothetical protein
MSEPGQFFKQGMGIRDVLQAVEDALIDSGYQRFAVATEHGNFQWETDEAPREDFAGDGLGDQAEGQPAAMVKAPQNQRVRKRAKRTEGRCHCCSVTPAPATRLIRTCGRPGAFYMDERQEDPQCGKQNYRGGP